ncbi:MAG: InlB B-repeat-containing protein, partial [Clostridiales bacterium]|nr:InlB B-repeat-containing protein [Clostridiales bacterium]
AAQGDVLAIVSGHDHENSFIVPYRGIDLINTPTCGFSSYGGDSTRGARIIDLDEATGTYSTHTILLSDYNTGKPEYFVQTGGNRYVKDIALCYFQSSINGGVDGAKTKAYNCIYNAVDAAHGNGVVIASDLNNGTNDTSSSNHIVVYMGYTYTNDSTQALRKLGIFAAESSSSPGQYDGSVVNGIRWYLCNSGSHTVSGTDGAVDLNKGTKGNPMYFYASYDTSAGLPITDIEVVSLGSKIDMSNYPNHSLTMPFAGTNLSDAYADLNKTAGGDYIYALYTTGTLTKLNSVSLRVACNKADRYLSKPVGYYGVTAYNALNDAVSFAKNNILRDLEDGSTTQYNQAAIDNQTNLILNCMSGMTIQSYVISFNGNGVTCNESPRTRQFGEVYGTLPVLSRTGYYFAGWYTALSGGDMVTESSPVEVSSNTTLYAHWTPHRYTIIFDPNGGTGTMSNIVVNYGEQRQLPSNSFQRTEYSFAGWNTSISGNGTAYQDRASVKNLTASDGAVITLYAQWNAHVYSINYDLQGGENSPANPSSYTIDTPTITLANASKTGYIFNGWTGNGTTVQTLNLTLPKGSTGDKTYTAVFSPISYTITYDGNGNTGGSTAYSRHTYDAVSALTLNGFNKNGYDFAGWSETPYGNASYTDGQSIINLTTAQGANITLYAVWAIKEYSITYDLCGGKLSAQNPETYSAETPDFTLNNPTRIGYAFNGWTGTGYPDASTEVTIPRGSFGDRSYTATWTPNTYIIIFEPSGGICSTMSKQVVYDDPFGELPVPTRNGYVFKGWFTAVEDGDIVTSESVVKLTENITLYAHWEKTEIISVTVNTMPMITTYFVGDQLDTYGLTLTAKYNNGNVKTVSSGFTCTPTVFSEACEQKITVTINNRETEFYVTVLSRITVSSDKTVLKTGETVQLSASDTQELTGINNVVWTSSDTKIATVDANGKVKAIGVGNVLITATDEDGNVTTVLLKIEPNDAAIFIKSSDGGFEKKVDWWKPYSSAGLSLYYRSYNCVDAEKIVWSSSNSRVNVDQNGRITNTGSFSRSAVITVTAYDASDNVIASDSVTVRFYKFNWQFGRLKTQSAVSDNVFMSDAPEQDFMNDPKTSGSIIIELIGFIFDFFGRIIIK